MDIELQKNSEESIGGQKTSILPAGIVTLRISCSQGLVATGPRVEASRLPVILEDLQWLDSARKRDGSENHGTLVNIQNGQIQCGVM